MSIDGEPDAPGAPARLGQASNRPLPSGLLRSPAAKFFLTGAVTVLLIIPLFIVLGLTSDRAGRRDEVAQSVSREWGGPQMLFGPVLVVPYLATEPAPPSSDRPPTSVLRNLAILPETMQVDASAEVEERSVSIYDVPVFSSLVTATGKFGAVDPRIFGDNATTIFWDRAYIALGVSDLSGVEDAGLTVRGAKLAFEPGAAAEGSFIIGGSSQSPSGIHASLAETGPITGFDYALDLRVRGTGSLMVAPIGRQSEIAMKSNWAHPNFTVGMLPSERKLSDAGFDAKWRVPYLARTAPQTWTIERDGFARFGGDLLGVGFASPVDLYALVERALKYGIMFIGATFLTVFMLEVFSVRRIHIVQYCLVGLVLVMFFVLLLALSERIGFGLAYLAAAGATGAVVSAFVGTALESRTKAVLSAASLAVSFALLYAILRLEDLALLAGALVGFIVLSVILFATRRVDWSGVGNRVSSVGEARPGTV
jgi:inner membrane protein